MKIFLFISASVLKVVLFTFVLVFNNGLYQPLIPILLTAMLALSGIETTCFSICYSQDLKNKELNLLRKVTILSFAETSILSICLAIFLAEQIINGIILLWIGFFVLILYLCRPRYKEEE